VLNNTEITEKIIRSLTYEQLRCLRLSKNVENPCQYHLIISSIKDVCGGVQQTKVAKKVSHKLLSISSPNFDRFSNLFHQHILWKNCSKVVTKYTTMLLHCHTTLWNLNL